MNCKNEKIIYICQSCHFLFESSDIPERCPDCGKPNVRTANTEEQKEYQQLRIEFGYEKSL